MTPYCYLESVYDNPYEITVPIRHRQGERIPRQTVRQVMRDLLPGTWNGRTIPSGGGYYNASRVGGTGLEKFEHAHPNIYHVKLDSNPLRDEGDYVLKSPQRIKLRQSTPRAVSDFPIMLQPPGSDNETCFTLIEPRRVNLERWAGVPRGENARVYVPTQANFMVADVPGIVDKFDIIAGSQTTTPGQLPEAWPSSWTFTKTSDRSLPVRGYSPSRPSAPNGALTREVTAHPLMGALFSSVKRDDNLQVETVTTHVARSRGITLRYRTTHDGKPSTSRMQIPSRPTVWSSPCMKRCLNQVLTS